MLLPAGQPPVETSDNEDAKTVAGHQCQYPGVDSVKPTWLFSDLPGIEDFGYLGWPILDSCHNSRGPLPRDYGHRHHTKTNGKDEMTENAIPNHAALIRAEEPPGRFRSATNS